MVMAPKNARPAATSCQGSSRIACLATSAITAKSTHAKSIQQSARAGDDRVIGRLGLLGVLGEDAVTAVDVAMDEEARMNARPPRW